MNNKKLVQFINDFWDKEAIPALQDFIKIPNKSPEFDSNWETNGYMDQAERCISAWCKINSPKGMQIKTLKTPGRTPIILIDIPGEINKNILFYGHLDKQPEMSGWDDDLGPYTPVIKDGKLYGRGSGDDGYAVFSAISSILAIQKQNLKHPNIQIMIEASEESGSIDLPFYINKYEKDIIKPDMFICLDSGCGDYDRMWLTTSLRGMATGILEVEVLTEGVHSGMAGGIAPSALEIMQHQLQKISTPLQARINLPELKVNIPKARLQQIKEAAAILGENVAKDFPFAATTQALSDNNTDLITQQTWLNSYAIIGLDGIPSTDDAGNVHIPKLTAKISLRLAPTCDTNKAIESIKQKLELNPPYCAAIKFSPITINNGWHANIASDELSAIFDTASLNYFGEKCAYMGEGGSIPFINMLQEKFPSSEFVITGVLGPQSNAHGPNEFLHLAAVKKISCCIADIVYNFYKS